MRTSKARDAKANAETARNLDEMVRIRMAHHPGEDHAEAAAAVGEYLHGEASEWA